MVEIVTTPGKVAAISILQREAFAHFAGDADRRGFIAYGRARLDKLTEQEADVYLIQPEQFNFWHSMYFGQSSEQPVAKSEHAAEKEAEEPPTKSDRSAPKKRATSSGENAPATPKGIAKFLAKHVEPYVPEEFRPYVRWALVIIGGALLTPLIVLLNTHPWQALGAVAGVVAVAGMVVVVRKRLASADGAAPADQGPGTKDEGLGGAGAPSAVTETVGGALRPDSASDSNVSVSPRRPRRVYILALGGIGLAAAVTAAVYFWPRTPRPPIEAISAQLVKSTAPLPVRVAAINVTYLPGSEVSLPVQYQARLETIEPLFQPVNAAKYLQAHFATEYAVITAAEKLLAGPDAARIRAAAGPAPESSFSISACQLFSVSSPPGAATMVTGTVTAWQKDNAWVFTGSAPFVDRRTLAGEPKPAGALVVDFPEDQARLAAVIAEQTAYATKVQAAATALAADLERERQQQAAALERERQQKSADLERERQQKTEALAHVLQRGSFFTGVVIDVPKPDAHPVLLEVTDCSATTHKISVLLRNQSGWYNTRPAQGEWSIDADDETCTARVLFGSFDRIAGAGRPLDDPGSWYLTLRVRLDGTVAADPRNWDLHRVAAEDVAAAKADFGFGRAAVAAATKESGVKDSGARSSDSTGASAPIVAAGLPRDPAPSAPDSNLSVSDFQFFSVCAVGTAYARVDGTWVRLPTNSAKAVQGVAQKLGGVVASLGNWQDKLAGKSSTTSPIEAGEIKFDGIETIPAVPAKDVLIVYVGPLTPISEDAKARYPELKDYPVMELALEKTAAKGVRYATLYRLPAGLLGFGTTRVMNAAVESAAPNLTVLRGTSPIPRGRYALACGPQSYEIAVE